jgi:lyso-ornithine lipid O-acyltransferase
LLVCNHLSYMDVLALGSIAPAVFVAKREVKYWPIFGWFALLAGTVFVERQRREQAAEAVDDIEAMLKAGQLLVLFPEGTSSDGRKVLPFKSALLEPATRGGCPLFVGHIAYELEQGDVAEEVCYWKDMTFLPHLMNLLTKRSLIATIRFSEVHQAANCRKELARHLRSEIAFLGGVCLEPERA